MELNLNPQLVQTLVQIAREQGRTENEVLEEAVLMYLRERGVEAEEPDIGKPLREVYVEPQGRPRRPGNGFLALLDRMSSRFDLDEDEAMRIAVEEQHAFRAERREQERAEK